MNVSLPEIEELIAKITERYGLAFKIAGAGGGGCLVSFPMTQMETAQVEKLGQSIREIVATARIITSLPSLEGVRVEK